MNNNKIITRFAPSPTGLLHIGGARIALFNWIFARQNKGKFLLRIEDTDRKRSTDEAVSVIIKGLEWLSIDCDELFYQTKLIDNHQMIVNKLLEDGNAYKCYLPISEKTKSPWRDSFYTEIPKDITPCIRLKVPEGTTIFNDIVYGTITVNNNDIDDFVIQRNDGTPTYMLAAVTDDHQMEVSHIIRGVDHLTNTSKQCLIYDLLDWERPKFSHIPLIHGSDGSKLSKRHGAISILEYQNDGILPKAMIDYLLHLGWSDKTGNNEINLENALSNFKLEDIQLSSAQFDRNKLLNINHSYIKNNTKDVIYICKHLLIEKLQKDKNIEILSNKQLEDLISLYVDRSKTTNELYLNTISCLEGLLSSSFEIDDNIKNTIDLDVLKLIIQKLQTIEIWNEENLENTLSDNFFKNNYKKPVVYKAIRGALISQENSPYIITIMKIIGKEKTLQKLLKCIVN